LKIEFEWDEWNLGHFAHRPITKEDCERVISDPNHRPEASRSSGLPIGFGWTAKGKRFLVVYRVKRHQPIKLVRVITAYLV